MWGGDRIPTHSKHAQRNAKRHAGPVQGPMTDAKANTLVILQNIVFNSEGKSSVLVSTGT